MVKGKVKLFNRDVELKIKPQETINGEIMHFHLKQKELKLRAEKEMELRVAKEVEMEFNKKNK